MSVGDGPGDILVTSDPAEESGVSGGCRKEVKRDSDYIVRFFKPLNHFTIEVSCARGSTVN